MHLYRYPMQDGGMQWFLSSTPHGGAPGGSLDVDFYCAASVAVHSCVPPASGWQAVQGSPAEGLAVPEVVAWTDEDFDNSATGTGAFPISGMDFSDDDDDDDDDIDDDIDDDDFDDGGKDGP